MPMTSTYPHATSVDGVSRHVEKRAAMGLRKKTANFVLGQDIDDLCLAWYQTGLEQGVEEGIDKAVNDIVTDILSDAILSMELDVEMLQRIVAIIEN